MVKLIFFSPDGQPTEVDAVPGVSVMVAAITNAIDGIEAECGGAMACGTCHVYVDEGYSGRLPPIGEAEDAMLDEAADRKPCSRLGCQILVAAELEGLVVHIPEWRG